METLAEEWQRRMREARDEFCRGLADSKAAPIAIGEQCSLCSRRAEFSAVEQPEGRPRKYCAIHMAQRIGEVEMVDVKPVKGGRKR